MKRRRGANGQNQSNSQYNARPQDQVWWTLTCTDAGPLADVSCVFTLQAFACVAGVHLRANLPFLAGTHQAAGAVVQDQGHPRETHGRLLGTLASPRTHLGAGQSKHLGGKEEETTFNMLLSVSVSQLINFLGPRIECYSTYTIKEISEQDSCSLQY